ncbi:MAG: FAD-dependent oxidoreductase [Anaerolineaceae bacterium]|jgi:NADPH-dependent 2,4-dienoyl-CoA reductase/sulfur reductase-like enzyme/peroxiredoxin family protein/rhodanese-related sulfurtransferase/TusA-related sulfurtransferase|nr:FAD-dependent oxidoreductase [Anaerolineaceae bacterium]
MKVVIVGGVAGGASTAARVRRMDENAEIVLLERGAYISFANCGLPYYIGDVISDRDKLLVVTPDEFHAMFNVDTRVNNEVVKINRAEKTVTVKNVVSGEAYTEAYDKLVLSPGASPVVPPVAGCDLPGVFSLRNIPDMDRIKGFINEKKPARAVVVGGGFIGLELAENLHHLGIQVTVIEMMNQVMAPLDYEMAAMVHQHLQFKQVRLALGDGLKSIGERNEGWLQVTLQSDRKVDAEMVILSIGVRPENQLARDAGLELGQRGTIVTNAAMQTSDPDIYAIGDAAEVTQRQTGKATALPLAGPASKQGRIVADHITGRDVGFRGVQGTSIVKVFELTVATTGLNGRQLEEEGIAYKSAIIHAANHAGYYPGASPMAFKLLFALDGKVLGAQVVGIEGVDKRVDVIATAIHGGMTVFDLEELELAYAPPFGSSRDPVNIIGFVAANMLRGDVASITWDEIGSLDREKDFILDVRTPEELMLGMLDGAKNISLEQIRKRINDIPKNRRVVVYCQTGQRSYFAACILKQHGYQAVNLSGGYKTYSHAVGRQSNFDIFENVSISSREEIQEIPPLQYVSGDEFAIDACGLQCPGPILKLYNKVKEVKEGDVITVTATDFGFTSDVKAWADRTGNRLISVDQDGAVITAKIQKGMKKEAAPAVGTATQDKTMVIFSGDLDKALAGFIIANGAAAMGHKVTMFFTFWGLNILRQDTYVPVKKNLVERMFGLMMPRGAQKLTLSQMHMAGMGTGMIKAIMKKKNVDSLPELIQSAQENGVRLLACQMSMDLMGIQHEELIAGVEIAGVATFIASSDESNATLFI